MRKHFTIPMLPYLKKYVVKQFFTGKPPYKIEEDTLIGKQFMSLVIDGRPKDKSGDKQIQMTKELSICLSLEIAKRSPTLGKLVAINYFLDKMFKDDLIVWIKSAEHYGIRPFVSSKDFLEHFGIDEGEYSHDAAYRHWLRFKNGEYAKQKKIRASKVENKGIGVHNVAPQSS